MPQSTQPLYLDSAASTRVAPEVCAAMLPHLDGTAGFANPSSVHHLPGRTADAAIEQARNQVAEELRCAANEVIFTSGATESINLAVRGIAMANATRGRHIVATAIEHKATLAACQSLADEGFAISLVPPTADGRVPPAAIAAAIRPDTLLISIMHVNNETGILQPIEEIAAVALEQGVLLHLDAAQSVGKFPLDVQRLAVDLLSLSAHKFHGPKGIGCLIVRDRARLPLRPLAFGGGQEYGLRPGTLPTHQIVGLARALRLAAERRDTDLAHARRLHAQFIEGLRAEVPLKRHGDPAHGSPYILNFSVPGIGSDALINQCAAEVAFASGSACSSGTIDPSHVLRAMGVTGEDLRGAVRVSFDRYLTPDDIAQAVASILAAIKRIQAL